MLGTCTVGAKMNTIEGRYLAREKNRLDEGTKPWAVQERDWLGEGLSTSLGNSGNRLDSLNGKLLVPENQENIWRIIKDLGTVAARTLRV